MMLKAAENQAGRLGAALRHGVQSVVAISEQALEAVLLALLAGGHALIEGIPGVGKTLLARTLARCVGGKFRRIQFTNDLLPSDIVGTTVWRPAREAFEFVPGPLFANIVLADEINRTSPRTLSCLLEAMEHGSVSVDDRSWSLGRPFFVLATRNPIEFHGTYPIPEAALDRFLVRAEIGYPTAEQELALYRGHDPEAALQRLQPVLEANDLARAVDAAAAVRVGDALADYCYRLVTATREHPAAALGASPRAAIAWLRACRARAFLHGRDYVIPDDLQATMQAVLSHRVFTKQGDGSGALLAEVRRTVPVEL
jgi:MoxR-like ATPase